MIADVLAGTKNYAYVNARVRARRGDLITDQEYRKLAKMELSEIAEFLGKRGYSQEMEAFGPDYSGEERISKAVRHNLARTYRELMAMAPEPVQELLALYFRKFDIENVKIILRAVRRDEDVGAMLVPTDTMGEAELERLTELDTVEEVLAAVDLPGIDGLSDQVDDDAELARIEDALDIAHHTAMVDAIAEKGRRSALFDRFIRIEATLANVSLVLRMARRSHDHRTIVDRLIPVDCTTPVDPRELAALGSEEEMLERLRASPVGAFMEGETPADIQRALETYTLKQGIRLIHEDQLGVNPVLGYMVCKEVEAQNVRMIARAKDEGLPEPFIERNLVEGVAS